MRALGLLLSVLILVAVGGAAAQTVPAAGTASSGEAPALTLVAHKEPGSLGTFRATFTFPGGWRPERDVLIALAPFSSKRDREGQYDAAKMFEAAEAVLGALGDGDRANVLAYGDLLHGESWFPNEFPFGANADDLFVRPRSVSESWQSPADALAGLEVLRERGVETLRNTSWFIELLRSAALLFEPGDGRVKEIVVIADSHTTPTKKFLAGLPIDLPEIKLEPLDPEWTAALFNRFRTEGVHVNFVVVAQDKKPAFRERRLRRMAEATRGFYFEWPEDEAARRRYVEHIGGGLYRGLDVDFGASDANYIHTSRWFPSADEGFVVRGRYGRPGKYVLALRDTLGGREWRYEVTLPVENAAPTVETEWARQRLLDGVWRLSTFGRDDYLTYDLQQLAHRYGLDLPEALRPSVFEEKPEAVEIKPSRGKRRVPEPPVLDEAAELPPHSALAELAPYDMLYVRYGRLRTALELLDMGYFYGRDTIQALGLHPDITLIEEQVQTQTCIEVSRNLTKLYETAIAEVAEVSTGASIGEGLDVCFLMRVKLPSAFRLRINQFRRRAMDEHPGTTVRRFRHEGVVVTETLGHHNVVRSYFAMFRHTPRDATKAQWFAVSGNSWAAVRRVLDVHVGKVPSVLANDDFSDFRTRLLLSGFTNEATGEHLDEDVFVYFGAPAVLALTDRRVQALQHEQGVVASHLRLLRDALASYARDRGTLLSGARRLETIMGTLVEEGYLPCVPVHPGAGAYAFDPYLQVFYSTRYGRLGWLTPIADLLDQQGEPHYGKPALGGTAAQLAWNDEVMLSRAITRPNPKDLKFALLRALAGRKTSDFDTFAELMRRPGLSVAMMTRLLQFGGKGLGMSREEIALNFLAKTVKREIRKAVGWEAEEDPFSWAGDEACIVLDAEHAAWRTALVDPSLAFGLKVEETSVADTVLEMIAKAPGVVEREVGEDGLKTLWARGWSLAMRRDEWPMLVVSRNARVLAEKPSSEDTPLRRFLPEKCHVLIRYDSTGGDELVRTALGLYAPAAEEQAQLVMARFESLYGNRLDPFRLETVPMLEEAPRPAGSQYFIEPVEQRIASTVYGLPGDFLLAGRVPLDSGVRKALAQELVGYGALVLHKDAVEFTGAAPNPGVAKWKEQDLSSSMTLSRDVGRLRATSSLDRLAGAVLSSDGYLWRLGLRGFQLQPEQFRQRLSRMRADTHGFTRAQEAIACYGGDKGVVPGEFTSISITLDPMVHIYYLDEIPDWQTSRFCLCGAVPRPCHWDTRLLLSMLGDIHKRNVESGRTDVAKVAAKLVGWTIICQGSSVADELKAFLETPSDAFGWPGGTLQFVRDQAEAYLRFIEHE